MDHIVLVSGRSIPDLAQKISSDLGISLLDPHLRRFANGEAYCEIGESVRGADVFVIQSICKPTNDSLMDLLLMLDALKRASAKSVTAVIPHYGYARQDRKASPRSPISAKLVADLITVAGATRVITMDIHAGQIQGFFDIPFDNIYASPAFLDYLEENWREKNTVIVSPDSGGVERVRWYAKKLKCGIAMIDKRRPGPNIAEAMNIVGDVKDKNCIIIDDIIDTAGTLVEGARTLKEHGAKKIYTIATHPVFSGPAIERIKSCEMLDRVIVADTIPLSPEAKGVEKIVSLSVHKIFSEVIQRTYNCDSLSTLFL